MTPTRAEIPVKKGDVNNNKPPMTTTATKTTTTTTTTTQTASPANDDDDEPRPESAVPTTPALTPALTGTTDDSDTDFQSAYSKTPSPRESLRGNFDVGSVEGSDAFLAAEKNQIPGTLEVDMVRKRVSSAATAIVQPSPTFSNDTTFPRHEGQAISRR
jgi:EEF1A N-terminal glycine/lysine methyltransferase